MKIKMIKSFTKRAILYRQYLRMRTVLSYYSETLKIAIRWVFAKTETDNFYYSLKHRNLNDLISVVSFVTGDSFLTIQKYIEEINSNSRIQRRIEDSWKSNAGMADAKVGFARRVGWYAVIRSIKPKLVVETGVSHGVGALVICAALERNQEEGIPGKYLGTDINPEAGSLILKEFKSFATILVGDSLDSLRTLREPIDLFINDSDHSAEYEKSEYEAIKKLLTKEALILGDNSHVTEELRDFSHRNDRNYLFFGEKPDKHWYPGAGIGFSFPKKTYLN